MLLTREQRKRRRHFARAAATLIKIQRDARLARATAQFETYFLLKTIVASCGPRGLSL